MTQMVTVGYISFDINSTVPLSTVVVLLVTIVIDVGLYNFVVQNTLGWWLGFVL